MTADDSHDDDRQIALRGIRFFDPFPAAELAALAADVQAIRMGFRPSEAMLAQCISIRMPSVSAYPGEIPSLMGQSEGRQARIYGLSMFAPDEGWARLLTGYVRIERTGIRRRR
jgi:hypothetical protein